MYTVRYLADVVKYDIPALPKTVKQTIQRAIEERLLVDPANFGNPLRYSLKGLRRLRVGDYRIVYRIEEPTKTILITTIKHRKDVYQE